MAIEHPQLTAPTRNDIGSATIGKAKAAVWHPWSTVVPDPLRRTLESGSGCWVWDSTGVRYLDAVASALNSTCGYGAKTLVEAAATQMARLPHYDLSVASHAPAESLAARLVALLPGTDHVFFVNSGSEAAEVAVRISLEYWIHRGHPRSEIVSFASGYHGSTALAQHLSGLPATVSHYNAPFPVQRVAWPASDSTSAPADELAELLARFAAAIGPQTAAVIVEPLLNVGGGIILPRGFLRGLRDLCDQHGTLLIADEVFTGFGRTGAMFGFEHDGITPDIVMMSKGLTSGYVPLGAVATRTGLYESFRADPILGGLRYGHTTGGHAVACAVALRVLDLLDEQDLVANASAMGARLLDLLTPLQHEPHVVDIRGCGLVTVIEFVTDTAARRVTDEARRHGLLLRCQGSAVMAVPPLVIDADTVGKLAERWTRAVRDASTPTHRAGPPVVGSTGPAPTFTPSDLQAVCDIWREVLALSDIGPETDFFAAGGTSIHALEIAARLYEQLGINISTRDVFDQPCPRALAGSIDRKAEPG